MSVSTFGFFAETVAPAWRSAWTRDKALAISCCAWFDFSIATIARLRESNSEDDAITYVAVELKNWDQNKIAIFCAALDILDGPPGLVNDVAAEELRLLESKREELSNFIAHLKFMETYTPHAGYPSQIDTLLEIARSGLKNIEEKIKLKQRGV